MSRPSIDDHCGEAIVSLEAAEERIRRALSELRGNGVSVDLALSDAQNAAGATARAIASLREARSLFGKKERAVR